MARIYASLVQNPDVDMTLDDVPEELRDAVKAILGE